MTDEKFLQLASALRALGATEVCVSEYSDEYRVVFGPVASPATKTQGARLERIAPEPEQSTERALWRAKVLERVSGHED